MCKGVSMQTDGKDEFWLEVVRQSGLCFPRTFLRSAGGVS